MRITLRMAGLTAAGLVIVIAAAALQAQGVTRSVWDGIYTEAQASRGKSQYDMHCAVCHGPELNGIDSAPGLTGPRFLANWSGQSVGDLVARTRSTMPLNDPGRLNRRVITDITAYVFLMNRFPASEAELPADAQLLQQILILTYPPASQ